MAPLMWIRKESVLMKGFTEVEDVAWSCFGRKIQFRTDVTECVDDRIESCSVSV